MKPFNPTPQDPTLAPLAGHGHVRPIPSCGGPALCKKCKAAALALPPAQIIFQRSQPPGQEGYPMRYVIAGRWEGDPNAPVEIASDCFSREGMDILEEHFGLYPIKVGAHSAWFLGTRNQAVPLVVHCTQHGVNQIPEMVVQEPAVVQPC